jgi:hypothetical protein
MKQRCAPAILFIALCALIVRPWALGQDRDQQEKYQAQWKKALAEYPPSSGSKELEFVRSFMKPGDDSDGNYLWDPRQLMVDKDGSVFVIDAKWKCLFKISPEGRIVKKAGRHGQGPGEFQNPISCCMNEKNLFISDTGKRDIQIFDKDLKYLNTIKVFKSYFRIAMSKTGYIVAEPFRMTIDMPLIDILDETGKLVSSFGEGLYGTEKRWTVPNFVHIALDDNDNLFLAYENFPTVMKYDVEGKLGARYELDNRLMLEAKKRNIASIADPDSRIYWPAISGMRASGKGFLLIQDWPRTAITEFDSSGKQITAYWTARSYDYHVWDFAKKEDTFYLLITNPNPNVEIFHVKRPAVGGSLGNNRE